MEWWMGVEMFGDGRLRVPSTSSLAGAGTSKKKGTHRAFIEIS